MHLVCLRRSVYLFLLLLIPAAYPVVAQGENGDSTEVRSDSARIHTPKGALRRAAILPGWGQYYNRQYYKMPFVYAGIGGMAAFAYYLNGQYLLYRHAYQYKAYQERVDSGRIEENPKAHYKGDYDQVAARYGDISSGPLRTQRDLFRRNRDLSYFGIGIVYGLTILDAYVSAHLMDFDVGEDLTLQVKPAGPGIQAAVKLSF